MVTISKTAKTRISTVGPAPEVVQDYIASMLSELADMASTSGLPHLSSLLQVSLVAATVDTMPVKSRAVD